MANFEDFLVEIGTEELPPLELPILATAFAALLKSYLEEAGISFEGLKTFAAPRRLGILIKKLANTQPEQMIHRRGPALTAAYNPDGTPTKAALGFASSCGVGMQELSKEETDKGAWLCFTQKQTGQPTVNLLPAMVEKSLQKLPIKKHMRWSTGEFSFARPVHWVLMLYGTQIVKANIFGITSSDYTLGHRIHSSKPIKINSPIEYEAELIGSGKVYPDFDARRELIRHAIEQLATQVNAVPVIDPQLLDLVTGLVEFPMGLLAEFNKDFLRVPKECLISAMQDHQKCFALTDKDGQLLPKFILIANLNSSDPATVIRGNELVMHARLADAAFHFDQDQKQTLISRNERLKNVVYQQKLGSIYDKVERIKALAMFICAEIATKQKQDSNIVNTVTHASELCKADLLTSMVYEFPELQGIMGYYYAKHDKQPEAVAIAIKEHYLPKTAHDILPESMPGICIALADRIDTLVGLFGIGSIPTGEKDPYGLRRQAIAVLRILIEKNIDIDIKQLFNKAFEIYNSKAKINDPTAELLNFCTERLKAWYLDREITAKTFAAVMVNTLSNPLDINKRIHAVNEFQKLPQAVNLAAANKRVQNILSKNPAKKQEVDEKLLKETAEQELFKVVNDQWSKTGLLLEHKDYTGLLKSLATLQEPVDNFFDHVMVMTDDEALRNNRLNLLQRLRELFLQVADVSLL